MIRFLADASLHDGIVTGCLRREPAIDFLSAHEATLEGVPDPEVLAFATHQNRILVTSDLRTMPRHFGDFLEANGQSACVFLVKQRAALADVIDALVLIWSEFVAVCSCEKTLLPSTGCPRDHCNWRHPIAHNVSLLRPRCPDFILRIGPTINVSRSLARSHDRKVGASGHHRREEHDARHRVGVGAVSSIYANPGGIPREGRQEPAGV